MAILTRLKNKFNLHSIQKDNERLSMFAVYDYYMIAYKKCGSNNEYLRGYYSGLMVGIIIEYNKRFNSEMLDDRSLLSDATNISIKKIAESLPTSLHQKGRRF